MTEHIDHLDPDDPDDAVDPAALDGLRALLQAPGSEPDDARRDATIAAALAAYDAAWAEHGEGIAAAAPVAPVAPVVPLGTRRRGPVRLLGAAAAAAVLVVGVGIGIRAIDSSSDADRAAVATAEKSATADAAADSAGSDAAATPGPATGADQFATSAAEPPADLGTFDEAAGLATAVLDRQVTARTEQANTDGTGGDEPGDAQTESGASGDTDGPPTTPASVPSTSLAAPFAGRAPAADAARCAGEVAALGVPRYTAMLAGRPVIVAPSVDRADRIDVVRLDDCSVTTAGR